MSAENEEVKQSSSADLLEAADKEINFEGLLSKYGPEGLYLIANKLKELADADLKDALAMDS